MQDLFVTRRQFLQRCGMGFGALSLAGLLGESQAAGAESNAPGFNPLASRAPHFAANMEEHEEERTRYLKNQGIKVIRFENRAVHDQIEFVLETIRENLRQMIPPN